MIKGGIIESGHARGLNNTPLSSAQFVRHYKSRIKTTLGAQLKW